MTVHEVNNNLYGLTENKNRIHRLQITPSIQKITPQSNIRQCCSIISTHINSTVAGFEGVELPPACLTSVYSR